MSQFKPISGEKQSVLSQGSYVKHRYIVLILTVAFSGHIMQVIHLLD
jgi:hypothetical protein